jgi:hypothetical protein
MVKKLSKEKKALANFIKEVNKPTEIDEKMEPVKLRIHQVYSDLIKKYLADTVVIQYNYLENLKARTKKCATPEKFEAVVKGDLAFMEGIVEPTAIEQIEFKMAKKVYKDVVQEKGKEFEYGHDLSFKYDNQDIKYLGFFDLDQAKKEQDAKNVKAS